MCRNLGVRWQAQRDTALGRVVPLPGGRASARETLPKGGVALRFPPHSKVQSPPVARRFGSRQRANLVASARLRPTFPLCRIYSVRARR